MRTCSLFIALLTLAFSGCAHHPDADSYPVVASVDSDRAQHVERMLASAGIHATTHGSFVMGVSVAPKDRARTIELLRRDAAEKGYQVWF
ncbi:MAG: hypothetical protein QM813_00330 [Verrucomicrobiota bacterium]